MKKRRIYQNYMLRPMIYMLFTRLMAAAIFFLIVVRFVKNGPAPSLVAGFLSVLFALFSYLIYLRMDGLRIPRVKYLRFKKKSDPIRMYGDMSDHTDDDPPVTFEDLEDEEKDFCSLMCNLGCLIVFTALSFILY